MNQYLLGVIIGLGILTAGLLLQDYLQDRTAEITIAATDMVEVSDRVQVSEDIIEGFEECDYIPRSVSINKKLRENGQQC